MSKLYHFVVRPFLFRLNAEQAHRPALRAAETEVILQGLGLLLHRDGFNRIGDVVDIDVRG